MTDLGLVKFIGKGITFPIQLTDSGSAVIETGFDLIKSSLKILLTWTFGTRFFLGEFGSRIESLIADPNDSIIKGVINDLIIEAINRFETRITLINTDIFITDNSVSITLTYRIINSQIEDSFIFPFYTKPIM